MKTVSAMSKYQELLADIERLYEGSRHDVAGAYWKIGQRLVEVDRAGRAQYGKRLTARLSADLSAKYGLGFSVNNFSRMRRFYCTRQKPPAPGKLTCTHYFELLSVRDEDVRDRLERRAESEKLSCRDLRTLVRRETAPALSGAPPLAPRHKPLRRPANLKLHTCKLAEAPGVLVPAGHILVDCGFFVYRVIPKTTRGFDLTPLPAYTYAAIVERVVDGDTVLAYIDVGFGTVIRKRLRLRGVDSRDVGSEQGEEARAHVARVLPPGAPLIVHSYSSDAYGRFVADILYSDEPVPAPPTTATFQRIIDRGIFLNQELLASGLAVRMVQ